VGMETVGREVAGKAAVAVERGRRSHQEAHHIVRIHRVVDIVREGHAGKDQWENHCGYRVVHEILAIAEEDLHPCLRWAGVVLRFLHLHLHLILHSLHHCRQIARVPSRHPRQD